MMSSPRPAAIMRKDGTRRDRREEHQIRVGSRMNIRLKSRGPG